MSRVFHVDPHPVSRLGLSRLLEAHPIIELVGHVGEIGLAHARLPALKPELIVTEIAFPGGGGIGFLTELVAKAPQGRVLVLTNQSEGLYAERCLRAGACGFLHKTVPEARLLDGIEAALRGEVVASDHLSRQMIRRAVLGDSAGSLSPIERLSDRELQVFELVGAGHNTRSIATRMKVSPKTVESHKARIKEKTGASDATQLLTIAVSWHVSRQMS